MKKMEKVSIRVAVRRHISLIYKLENEVFSDGWSKAQITSHVANGGVALVAEDENGVLLGYLLLNGVLDEWEIYRIAVDKKYRKHGIGSALLGFFLENFHADEAPLRLFLEVRRSNPARLFYERHGFIEVGQRKKYYSDGEDCILYSLCSS